MGVLNGLKNRISLLVRGAPSRPAYTVKDKGAALKALLQRTSDLDLMLRVLQTRRFARPVKPTFVHCPQGCRLMFLAPHQDDAIIGCGGLILHAQAAGKTLTPIYVTDGENFSPGYKMGDVPAARRREAEKVWEAIGGIQPIFWDIPNKKFPLTRENAQRLYDALLEHKPDCLFIPFFLEDPVSHRKTNHLLFMARDCGPLPDMEVWAYQVTSMICPNVGVEMSGVADQKRGLMNMWETQNAVFNYPHYGQGLNMRNSLHYREKDLAAPQVELFFVVPLNEYMELLESYFGASGQERLYGEKP